jgi:hypothetical protein
MFIDHVMKSQLNRFDRDQTRSRRASAGGCIARSSGGSRIHTTRPPLQAQISSPDFGLRRQIRGPALGENAAFGDDIGVIA